MRTRILGGIIAVLAACTVLIHPVHAIGPIVSMEVSPATATVASGATHQFTVTGKDASGATTDLTANTVFTTTDPLGSMAARTYTAGKAGTWIVSASYSTLTATAQVTVTPGALHELVVNPNSNPEYLVNGSSRAFSAEAYDAQNNLISPITIGWTVEGGVATVKDIGSTSTSVTATTVGTGTLVAQSGDIRALVPLKVTAAPATNANSNGNTNAASNTNGNTNVNRASNQNTNSATNATSNTNGNVNATSNDNANTNTANAAAGTCTGWPRAAWAWTFVAFLVLLVGSLYPIRRSHPTWWWIAPFVLTVVVLWLYFQFRCYPVYPALPYLVLLSTITAISWFNWQQPEPPILPKQ